MNITVFLLIRYRLLDYLGLFVHLPQVIYLRKFKNLRTLNLTGNPVCDNEVYAMFIAAYLPNLVYLDFRLVEENMVRISRGIINRCDGKDPPPPHSLGEILLA